jgi:hypothetical protein
MEVISDLTRAILLKLEVCILIEGTEKRMEDEEM